VKIVSRGEIKRKRSVLTLERKLEVIGEIQKGKSQRLVASVFDIPKSTVGDIWRERDKIKAHVSASENPLFAKKALHREGSLFRKT